MHRTKFGKCNFPNRIKKPRRHVEYYGLDVIKLAIACLLVGLVMSVLGFALSDIIGSGKRIVDWFIETFAGFVSGAGTFILLGSAVVLPIWLIMYPLKAARNRD